MLPNLVNPGTIGSPWACPHLGFFLGKLYEIIFGIEVVNTYSDDILVLIKDAFTKDIEHLRVIFAVLCNSGLKFNTKSSVWG